VTNTFVVLRLFPMSDRDKDTEILALRHQLAVLQRQLGNERYGSPQPIVPSSRRCCTACRGRRYAGCGCWSARTRSCAGIAT
jgi:hypothetical protein